MVTAQANQPKVDEDHALITPDANLAPASNLGRVFTRRSLFTRFFPSLDSAPKMDAFSKPDASFTATGVSPPSVQNEKSVADGTVAPLFISISRRALLTMIALVGGAVGIGEIFSNLGIKYGAGDARIQDINFNTIADNLSPGQDYEVILAVGASAKELTTYSTFYLNKGVIERYAVGTTGIFPYGTRTDLIPTLLKKPDGILAFLMPVKNLQTAVTYVNALQQTRIREVTIILPFQDVHLSETLKFGAETKSTVQINTFIPSSASIFDHITIYPPPNGDPAFLGREVGRGKEINLGGNIEIAPLAQQVSTPSPQAAGSNPTGTSPHMQATATIASTSTAEGNSAVATSKKANGRGF